MVVHVSMCASVCVCVCLCVRVCVCVCACMKGVGVGRSCIASHKVSTRHMLHSYSGQAYLAGPQLGFTWQAHS